MQGALNIFQGIVNSNNLDLDLFLKALRNHQSFCYNESNNSVVQTITSLLNHSSTRYTGFVVLSEFLKQGSLEVIEQKGVLWITLCTKACNPREQSSCNSLAYDVLSQIIQKSIDIPDLSKALSNHLLNKIFETLNNITTSSHLSALKMIEKCLKFYPGPCSQFRALIEKFVYSLIDSRDENIVISTGKCLHLLQQIRGTGMQGINFKNSWQTYQSKLLGSLHELLEMLYTNCSEVFDENIESERLQITPLELSDEPICRSSQLFTRITNLLTYLKIAIKEPFPVSKCIMPKKIFNLISRILAINCNILEKNSISDNIAIGILLPELHIQCFKLINTMILTLKSHLAMYYKTILNFVMDTLKWTSFGKSIGFCKPYNSLRICAYQTLSLWCETMKNGAECQFLEDTLFEQIIYDITPFQSELTLKVLSGPKKHMSKKARRLLHKAQNEQTHLIQAHSKSVDPQVTKKEFSDEGNENVCAAALNCLKGVLMSSSHCLKPILIKDIQDRILEFCIQSNSQYNQNLKSLYFNDNCRRKLYCIAYTLITSSHHLCPAPVQMIIKLINYAQIHDDCKSIREDCNLYMRNLEIIIHPHKDNLNFPNDLNEIKKALKLHHHQQQHQHQNKNRHRIASSHDETLDNENSSILSENSMKLRVSEHEDSDNDDDVVNTDINNTQSQKTTDEVELENNLTNCNHEEIELTATKNNLQQNEAENLKTIEINEEESNEEINECEPPSSLKGKNIKSVEIIQIDSENEENPHDDVEICVNEFSEPSAKRIRIESNNEVDVEEISEINTFNKDVENIENKLEGNENDLVDEIAKTFINELKEDSD